MQRNALKLCNIAQQNDDVLVVHRVVAIDVRVALDLIFSKVADIVQQQQRIVDVHRSVPVDIAGAVLADLNRSIFNEEVLIL